MSRPDLRIIEGGGEPDIDAEDFVESILSDHVARATERSIRILSNNPFYKLPNVEQIGFTGSMPMGSADARTMGRGPDSYSALITHHNFPKYLMTTGQFELDREEALFAASVYMRGFDILSRSLRYARSQNHLFLGSLDRTLWESAFWQGGRSVRYRAAGTICLRAIGRTDMCSELPEEPPFPPHIAGLLNPLEATLSERTQNGFLNLADTIKAYSKHWFRRAEMSE